MLKNKELKIGNVMLTSPFMLAPLAGITDGPFRRICGEMGAGLVCSEMVSAKGLWYKDKNTGRLLEILPGEDNVAYQIFGHEPEIMAFAARELESHENKILDINMGCPVPKIVKNGEGSALMKNPQMVYDIVSATVQATPKPVTVKIRAGWDDDSKNAVEVAKAIEAAGAAMVAVHGRTREQFYSGHADWSVIADVKKALKIPVAGNGDVVDAASARQMAEETGCDFIMIGRGSLGNPWIFRDLNAAWRGEEVPPPPTKDDKKAMMLRHFEDTLELKGEYAAVREMRKHVGWYLKGVHGAAAFRGRVNQITDADELRKAIGEI
ncbi:MAG: tRNA dihydrouridine synthase DusB [Firmicutes bacterium]|nr:tRNA dihydrouridine synthase DusB [Bacillota bacterium]